MAALTGVIANDEDTAKQLPKLDAGALDMNAISDDSTDADMVPDVGGGSVPVQTPTAPQNDGTVFGVQQADIQARRQAIQDAINRIQARQQHPTDLETQPLGLYSIIANRDPNHNVTADIMNQDQLLSGIKQQRLDKSDDANLQGALAQNQFLGQDQENYLKKQQIDAMAAWRQAQVAALQVRMANGSKPPAAVALANEIQKAEDAGDTERANLLRQSAKMGTDWSTPPAVTQPAATTVPAITPVSSVFTSGQGTVADVAPEQTPTTNTTPLSGDDYLKTLSPQKAAVVKMVGDGDEKSSTILSRMSPQDKLGFMGAVAQYNPNYNSNINGALKDWNTGKHGDAVRSIGVADQHLQLLSNAADALNNGNIQLFNEIGNKYAAATGNPAPTNFDAIKHFAASEVAKAAIGAGGTGEDRDNAVQPFATAASPAQLSGAANAYRGLMRGQANGLKQQFVRSTHKSEDDFESMLPDSMKNNANPAAFTIPQGAVQIGTKGGKAVYKLPDGSGLMEP